jgi:hypothetical protein
MWVFQISREIFHWPLWRFQIAVNDPFAVMLPSSLVVTQLPVSMAVSPWSWISIGVETVFQSNHTRNFFERSVTWKGLFRL